MGPSSDSRPSQPGRDGPPSPLRKVLLLAALAALAGAIRLVGIAREPVWLDEVFSIDFSTVGVSEMLESTARDTHPPLYYLGLQGWRRVAGYSEAAIRSYSTLWSVIGVLALVLLTLDVSGGRWWVAVVAGLLIAVNPLDVYFAQSARMYSQFAALATIAAWILWRWMTESDGSSRPAGVAGWPLAYAVVAAALVYTHYLAPLFLIVQGLVALLCFGRQRRWRSALGYLGVGVTTVLAFVPWILYVGRFRGGLYNPEDLGWIPRPTLASVYPLITRDVFWGRAALSGRWAEIASLLSILGVLLVIGALYRGSEDGHSRGSTLHPAGLSGRLYLGWLLVGPLFVALATSYLYHPVFFRPRFCVLVLAPFLALTAIACGCFRTALARVVSSAFVCLIMVAGSIAQYRVITNVGMRGFVKLWREHDPPDLAAFFPAHNHRLAAYYLERPMPKVTRAEVEARLQDGLPLRLWICTSDRFGDLATGRVRELHEWFLGLGTHRRIGRADDMDVEEVTIAARPAPAYRLGTRIDLASADSAAFLGRGWYAAEGDFRWSRGNRAHLIFGLEQAQIALIRLNLFCLGRQRVIVELNGREIDSFVCANRDAHLREIAVPTGIAATRNSLFFHLPDAVSPRELGSSKDDRRLAIGVRWLLISGE